MNSVLSNKTEFLSKLYLGDCLEIMKEIPDASVDLVLCDPPYGTTGIKWDSIVPLEPMWNELLRIAKPNAAIVMFGAEPFSTRLRDSNLDMFKYDWIWVKNCPTGIGLSRFQPMRDHEVISVFYRKPPVFNKQMAPSKISDRALGKRNGKFNQKGATSEHTGDMVFNKNKNNPENILKPMVNPRTTLYFDVPPRAKGTFHPTQKPTDLLEYLIRTYTNPGDVVLDQTMGSGSTGVACKNTGRNFIGIEKEQSYFEIAETRIASS